MGIVSIPSNGSSLFQSLAISKRAWEADMSQSPQTGQVYFNKFNATATAVFCGSQSPQTGQVYFNFNSCSRLTKKKEERKSQSPQTGQVYFNVQKITDDFILEIGKKSQSPQTGQVYFNIPVSLQDFQSCIESQSPQTGQVYFNLGNSKVQ